MCMCIYLVEIGTLTYPWTLAVEACVYVFVYLLCCVDSDGYEFQIVSLHNKEWQFEAPSHEVSVLSTQRV